MEFDFDSQAPFACKLDWGVAGTERAALRGDIIVLVDTLSFSTTTAYAVSSGACIYPCAEGDDSERLAQRVGGEVAVDRGDVPELGRYSLSPGTYGDVQPGQKIVLPSLNGGSCSRSGESAPYVFVGALVNASAVARVVNRLLAESGPQVTVVACGEREKTPDPGGDLRVAIEDYLGAGAVIAAIEGDKSPEARVCEAAFIACVNNLSDLIWDSVSGRELRRDGFGDDVVRACRRDSQSVVPVLKNGAFVAFADGG